MFVADGVADRAAAGFPDELPEVADAVGWGGVEVDGDGEGRIQAVDRGYTVDGPVVVGRQAVVAGAEGVENLVRGVGKVFNIDGG